MEVKECKYYEFVDMKGLKVICDRNGVNERRMWKEGENWRIEVELNGKGNIKWIECIWIGLKINDVEVMKLMNEL